MVYEVVNLGNNLEDITKYDPGTFPPVKDAIKSKDFFVNKCVHFSTLVLRKDSFFKVINNINLAKLVDPKNPKNLIKLDFDAFRGRHIVEFAIVSPQEKPSVEYAVLLDDPRYLPLKTYDEADLRYIGSLLSRPVSLSDARRHKVLMAAFDGQQYDLQDFLKDLESKMDEGLEIKVRTPKVMRNGKPSTVSLIYNKDRNKLVVRADGLGKNYLYHEV